MSELCLRLYLDEYDETPWDALKYLISEINYGGRVTDDWDRRLMNVYMASFFNEVRLRLRRRLRRRLRLSLLVKEA